MMDKVRTVIAFEGAQDDIDDVIRRMEGVNGMIDFESVIPMPREVYKGVLNYKRLSYYPENWYEWRRKNWGTSSNAQNVKRDGNTVRFETDWAAPYLVLKRIALDNPSISMHVLSASQRRGVNCGDVYYQYDSVGEKTLVITRVAIEDASEMARDIWSIVWA